jgi:Helix-hairpin-helix containing domain
VFSLPGPSRRRCEKSWCSCTATVSAARAVRIFKTYGSDAIQVMTENPYRLARDIRGIGFKTADAIAMKLGIEKTAMIRVRAGISYALTEAMDEGHCGLPTAELIPLAEKLLTVPQQLIRTALDLELQEGTMVADRVGETPCVLLAGPNAGSQPARCCDHSGAGRRLCAIHGRNDCGAGARGRHVMAKALNERGVATARHRRLAATARSDLSESGFPNCDEGASLS